MDDDRIRELAREGMRPLLGETPKGPSWEELTTGPGSKRRPAWAAAALTAVIVLGGVALLPILMGGTTGVGTSTTSSAPSTTTASTTADTSTTTVASTTTVPPSGLPLETPVQLQVLSLHTRFGLEVLDLQLGTRTGFEVPGVAGAVYNSQRELIMWNNEAVQVFGPDFVEPENEFAPSQPPPTGSMWVVPATNGDTAWIVQPGTDNGPTFLELRNIETGERLIVAETEAGLTPVGTTDDGLVFNTTDNQVVLFTNSGATLPLGNGRGIATNSTSVVRLVCGDEPADCEDLHLTRTDGTDDRALTKPDPGIWKPLSGPLQSISPDGSQLLIYFEISPLTTLHIVDLEDGRVQPIAQLPASDSVAAWSADGDWIALINGSDVDLINAADPTDVVPLRNVIPEGFVPIAAG